MTKRFSAISQTDNTRCQPNAALTVRLTTVQPYGSARACNANRLTRPRAIARKYPAWARLLGCRNAVTVPRINAQLCMNAWVMEWCVRDRRSGEGGAGKPFRYLLVPAIVPQRGFSSITRRLPKVDAALHTTMHPCRVHVARSWARCSSATGRCLSVDHHRSRPWFVIAF